MSHSGPSAAEIVLSEDERAELVRRTGLPGRWRADRARIILACAGGCRVNTKTKMIKRQIYGRAGFQLLRHQILLG